MIAALLLAVDARGAAKLAHPHDQGRFQHAAIAQVFHQGSPGRIEELAQGANIGEVLLVRVPAQGVAVEGAQADLDKGHAAFDEAAGQEAALAEGISAIGIAGLRGFLFEIKGPGGGGAHQPHGPFVGGPVAGRRQPRMPVDKILLHPLQQIDAGVRLGAGDVRRRGQIFHAQVFLVIVALRLEIEVIVGADHEGREARPEETRPVSSRIELPVRSDADEVRQSRFIRAQLLRHQRTERGKLDRALGQIAGPHVEGGPPVVAFARAHGANDHHVVHVAGDLGQVLADADARNRSGNLAEGPAVDMAGLQIEGVHLAGAAVHPQEDAGPPPLRMVGGVGRQGFQPAGLGIPNHARCRQLHQVAPGKTRCRHGHVLLSWEQSAPGFVAAGPGRPDPPTHPLPFRTE